MFFNAAVGVFDFVRDKVTRKEKTSKGLAESD
jgi:hypothetical protein